MEPGCVPGNRPDGETIRGCTWDGAEKLPGQDSNLEKQDQNLL